MYEKADGSELVSAPFFASYTSCIIKKVYPKINPIHHGARPGKRAHPPGGGGGISVSIAGGVATGRMGGTSVEPFQTFFA